jgi:general nucleoside transport system permease protein
MASSASWRSTGRALVVSISSVAIGLVLVGGIVGLAGHNPLTAFTAMVRGATYGSRNIELTFLNAIPLVFTGLSVAVAFRAGLFNIGAEGQVMIGGIAAAAISTSVAAGSFFTPLIALFGSAVAGIAWALPAAWLKGRRQVHEVITTLMLSYIALYLTTYARRYPLFDPKSTSQSSVTIPPDAQLPTLDLLGSHLGRLHAGLLIAIAASIITWFFLYRTVWGFEIRAVGSSPAASSAAGIDDGRTFMTALCAGGGLAGLGGGVQLLGLYHRISTDSFIGLGFAGFFIALVARNNPLAVLPSALFFGALQAGGLNMQFAADLPINVVALAQGVIILVLATPVVGSLLDKLQRYKGTQNV